MTLCEWHNPTGAVASDGILTPSGRLRKAFISNEEKCLNVVRLHQPPPAPAAMYIERQQLSVLQQRMRSAFQCEISFIIYGYIKETASDWVSVSWNTVDISTANQTMSRPFLPESSTLLVGRDCLQPRLNYSLYMFPIHRGSVLHKHQSVFEDKQKNILQET